MGWGRGFKRGEGMGRRTGVCVVVVFVVAEEGVVLGWSGLFFEVLVFDFGESDHCCCFGGWTGGVFGLW